MTVLAPGRLRPVGLQRQTMHARVIARRPERMAGFALDRLGGHSVIRMLRGDVIVATDAGVGAVNRPEQLRRVHIERDRPAQGIGFYKQLVCVALQASAGLDPFCREDSQWYPLKGKKRCG